MHAILLALMLAQAPAPGAQTPPAAPASTAQSRVVTVNLSSYDFSPEVVRLRADEPMVLRLINSDDTHHRFTAPQFFARAVIAPGQRVRIHYGEVDVGAGSRVDIALVPARGTYELTCSHTFHEEMGMSGRIVVE